MRHGCSDRRLLRLVKNALIALEDPATGFVFDDFDLRRCEEARIREKKSSEWFYHDKTPFETKYESDCGTNGGCEPAWISDCGCGAAALREEVAFNLDGPEEDPQWLILWRQQRRKLKPKQRAVLDALAIDWRSRPAARIAGVSHKTVNDYKKFFKMHFAQCFQAWNGDFAF